MTNQEHFDLTEELAGNLQKHINSLIEQNRDLQHRIDLNNVYCEVVDSCRRINEQVNYNLIFNHPESEIRQIASYKGTIDANNETIRCLQCLFPPLLEVRSTPVE